jgi:hypothetical protein
MRAAQPPKGRVPEVTLGAIGRRVRAPARRKISLNVCHVSFRPSEDHWHIEMRFRWRIQLSCPTAIETWVPLRTACQC